MFDNILVPTDGSDCAQAAVGYAADLATRYEASVHALSVVDSRMLEDGPQSDEVTKERATIAERACNDLSESGISVEQAVRTDIPHKAILRYATEQGVDLIVMGTHGRTGVERYLLGSVTERVVRLSDAPVLTVKTADDGGVTYPYTDILVPTDGSEGAEAAISPAIDVGNTYDARLHALSVIDTMALGLDVRSAGMLDALEESARSAVETIEKQATQASVSGVETAIEHGNPYRGIRAYVEEHDIDLVVMGTQGRSGIERYLLGSVAEKTVRTSPVPVMTVRQSE
ncbi:universal stress protein [Haloarcula nitratireducens]|uniref:Universal stress protein n=1 Tax=Haloarcula nitratireducens TaxID=2487749 RepID=A0AAW4PF29_9EURY|nr:universal stress protein [Halomicroarcula nitratireducens]MBX0296140.1 universal stress protein [Halomicroarcula nitratireducens]